MCGKRRWGWLGAGWAFECRTHALTCFGVFFLLAVRVVCTRQLALCAAASSSLTVLLVLLPRIGALVLFVVLLHSGGCVACADASP